MSSKKYYVYELVDPKTNKPFYIGKGTGKRCKFHLSAKYSYSKNKRLFHAINEIRLSGEEIIINIVKQNMEENEAYSFETELIIQYGRKDYDPNGILVNYQVKGGRPSHKGFKHSEEAKRKMSETRKGRIPWNKGETGIYSEETLIKMRSAKRTMSEETRLKLSKAKIGKKHSKPMSEEKKKKLSKYHSHIWRVTFPDGTVKVIENLRQFALDNNISQSNLCYRGKASGYTAIKIAEGPINKKRLFKE